VLRFGFEVDDVSIVGISDGQIGGDSELVGINDRINRL